MAALRGFNRRRVYIRTVSKQGNSIMVAIPTGFLHQLRLIPGDHLELELESDDRGFFARPLRREPGRGVHAPTPPPRQEPLL